MGVECRLGFLIDFMSKATLVGFMAGAAIIVSLQQLKGLLGISHFTTEMGIIPVMSSVFHTTDEVRLVNLVQFVCSFVGFWNLYLFVHACKVGACLGFLFMVLVSICVDLV